MTLASSDGDLRRLAATCRNPFDQCPILLEPLAAFLKLGDRQIVLILHPGDRIGGPEIVGHLLA